MAKIFRFSGYFVDTDNIPYSKEEFSKVLKERAEDETPFGIFQQLHIEESKDFDLEYEDAPNCDLALLQRHFKQDYRTYEFDRPHPEAGERYRHFKGNEVTVIGIARHTETNELTVVYKYKNDIWNRPLEMFMSEVDHEKYPDATQKYRFEKVSV